MIDVKQAIGLAKENAMLMLDKGPVNVEELERDVYRSLDVWAITLSFARDLKPLSAFSRAGADPLQYKRFLIDVETGELLAMKIRETAPMISREVIARVRLTVLSSRRLRLGSGFAPISLRQCRGISKLRRNVRVLCGFTM